MNTAEDGKWMDGWITGYQVYHLQLVAPDHREQLLLSQGGAAAQTWNPQAPSILSLAVKVGVAV